MVGPPLQAQRPIPALFLWTARGVFPCMRILRLICTCTNITRTVTSPTTHTCIMDTYRGRSAVLCQTDRGGTLG